MNSTPIDDYNQFNKKHVYGVDSAYQDNSDQVFKSIPYHYTLTDHLDSVRSFMDKAKQTTSFVVRCPSPEERLLRAKLIYEEAMETIEALGVDHILGKFVDAGEDNYNPVAVLDGACDLAVVTNGTLIACGLDGVFPEALERVDRNNMEKVGLGSVIREDGKILKPAGFVPVNLKDLVIYEYENM